MGKMRDRARRPNGPPKDEPWAWRTREMLASEAWRAMPLIARQVIERVEIEHMNHAGTENGQLIVTNQDFARYGIPRRSVSHGLAIAEGLGFLRIQRGIRSYGTAKHPNRFLMTWLPHRDGSPPLNPWKRIKTPDDAMRALETAAMRTGGSINRRAARGRNAPALTGPNIISRAKNSPGKLLPFRLRNCKPGQKQPWDLAKNSPGEMICEAVGGRTA